MIYVVIRNREETVKKLLLSIDQVGYYFVELSSTVFMLIRSGGVARINRT